MRDMINHIFESFTLGNKFAYGPRLRAPVWALASGGGGRGRVVAHGQADPLGAVHRPAPVRVKLLQGGSEGEREQR